MYVPASNMTLKTAQISRIAPLRLTLCLLGVALLFSIGCDTKDASTPAEPHLVDSLRSIEDATTPRKNELGGPAPAPDDAPRSDAQREDTGPAADSLDDKDGQDATDTLSDAQALVDTTVSTEISDDAIADIASEEIEQNDVQGPPVSCDPASTGAQHQVVLPLGETLFFDGDDYLAFWGQDHPCNVTITSRPATATASIRAGHEGERLTPDTPGLWTLQRGGDTLSLHVSADSLSPETFLNFNYTPVQPLSLIPQSPAQSDLWVSCTTSNRLQRVIITGEEAIVAEQVAVGAWPTAVVHWPDADLLLVAQTARDSLGFVDPTSGRLIDAIRVGNEPAGIVLDTASSSGPVAYVSLSGANRVARVDLETRQVTKRIAVGRDPRAMALDAPKGRLYVASLISSNAHPLGVIQDVELDPEAQRDIAIIDTTTFERIGYIHEVGTILRGLMLHPSHNELLVALSHSNNTEHAVDAESQPHSHRLARVNLDESETGYGTVHASTDLDYQPSSSGPAPSPFTLGLSPNGEQLVATLSAGQALLVLDSQSYEEVTRIPTGSDPRGLVFAHGRVWTYAWLDNSVQSWNFPAMANDSGWQLTVGADPTPLEIKQGQRMFNDASFSRHGDFSCNNCHIDGLSDGLTWDLLTDGPVNTIAFRNVGGTSPFLWGAQLPTLFDFSREVLKLVGATASGEQMHLLTLYMQSVVAPPNPWTLPGGRLTPLAEQGRRAFETPVSVTNGAGCISCHNGPLLTNREFVIGKTDDIPTDVPSLFGVYDTGPWGRSGHWETMDEMVTRALEFTHAQVDEATKEALIAYVEQLPGDTLYLTSAQPLNNSDHVWFETPVALQFSSTLAPNQLDKFSFHQLLDGETLSPVEGQWQHAGRTMRFEPSVPFALDTDYQIDIALGLEGVLGHRLPYPFVVRFSTGGIPGTLVSGHWELEVCNPAVGCLPTTVSLLQSAGGQVTGVGLEKLDEGSVDHLEGVVDGMVLALDPFYVDTIFGLFFIEDGAVLDLSDEDNDGFADLATGVVELEVAGELYALQITVTRTALPDESD